MESRNDYCYADLLHKKVYDIKRLSFSHFRCFGVGANDKNIIRNTMHALCGIEK
jgi:hypothetical protein